MTQSLLPDGVKFATPTTGTGPLVAGTAVYGFRGAEALVDGGEYSYWISDTGGAYESGSGIYTLSGQTLTRVVGHSSNANALVNLSGSAQVAIVARGQDIAAADLSNIAPSAMLRLQPVTAPSSPASGWIFYCDVADGRLKAKASSGQIVEIGQP